MKFAMWLAVSLIGAGLAIGPVAAQEAPPSMSLAPKNIDPPMGAPRYIPRPRTETPQSPDAVACANAGGQAEARLAACSKLIESGNWKGKNIAWAHANRCVVEHALGRSEKALADCDTAIELDSQNPVPYQVRAELLGAKGEKAKAFDDYAKAIELGARNAALYLGRGNLLLAAGDADKAVADYDEAVKIDEKNALAYMDRAGARLFQDQIDAAIGDFDKTIALKPGNVFAWYNRGAAYFEKGDKDKAIENFREALKLDPANAYAGLWLFIARGGDAEAKAGLQADSQKFSKKSWPWPVAQFYLGEKDTQQLSTAATTPGDQCEAQFYIGQDRLLKKAGEEAAPYLRKAVETCPKDFIEVFHARSELKKLDPAAPAAEAAPKAVVAPKAVEAPKADEPAKPQQ
jgi:lipoprotein NlpI